MWSEKTNARTTTKPHRPSKQVCAPDGHCNRKTTKNKIQSPKPLRRLGPRTESQLPAQFANRLQITQPISWRRGKSLARLDERVHYGIHIMIARTLAENFGGGTLLMSIMKLSGKLWFNLCFWWNGKRLFSKCCWYFNIGMSNVCRRPVERTSFFKECFRFLLWDFYKKSTLNNWSLLNFK